MDPTLSHLAGGHPGLGGDSVLRWSGRWASLNAGNSLLSTSIIPENVSFQHYANLFNGNVNYLTWYWNSMKISFLTMVLTLISVSFTAYAFSRFRFKGRQNGLMLFLLLQIIRSFPR